MFHADGTIDTTFGTGGFRTFDFNGNAGTHSFESLLVLPDGDWMTSAAMQNFIFRKFCPQSDVPHISETMGVLSTTGIGTYQWYCNDTLIASATQSTFTIIQNGVYTVMLTDAGGCTYLSEPFTVANAGLNELSANGFVISPNPVKDELKVSGIKFKSGDEIKITDVVGKEIYSDKIIFETSDMKLQTSNLQPGVYFLKINSANKKFIAKFIKQ
jgi:hypothetical protein